MQTPSSKPYFKLAAMVFGIWGCITFSLFILEEAIQTVMFGTWASQQVNDWHHVGNSFKLIRKINGQLKFVNTWFGWCQPFSYIGYKAYGEAAESYTDAMVAKLIFNAPEELIGETIKIKVKPNNKTETGFSLGQLQVITNKPFKIGEQFQIQGKIDQDLKLIIQN